jgi:hypothetical protein
MKVSRHVRPLLSAAAVVAAALPAAPASAYTTIGSSLIADASSAIACGTPAQPDSFCTVAQTELPDRPTVAPADGVIVRWRIRSASGGTVRLRVLRPADQGRFTGVGRSASEQVSGSGPGSDQVFSFVTRLPVRHGDFVGVDRQRRVGAIYHARAGQEAYGLMTFQSPLAQGASRAPDEQSSGFELLLNADVEPDADGDGFGDESQDNCPTVPNDQTTNPCPTPPPPPGDDDEVTNPEGPPQFHHHRRKRHHRPRRRGARRRADSFGYHQGSRR